MLRAASFLITAFFVLSCLPGYGQRIITTFAGRDWVFPLQAQPAKSEPLSPIEAVAVDAVGNTYIPDHNNNIVLKVDTSGNASVFAGNGIYGYSGDNGKAVNASLAYPTSVAVDPAGNIYIGDADNNRIRRVDAQGNITTFAGTGDYTHGGDGGPALAAGIEEPYQLAFGPAGSAYANTLYIVEFGPTGNWVRAIDGSGIINTAAGNGRSVSAGDGGPATSASFNAAESVAVDAQGNIYIGEFYGDRVRKVTGGIITTFAGTGQSGFSGDGGPAANATFSGVWGLALDGRGNLFISDANNKRIRKVDSAGVVTTVAGSGSEGFAGDGGPALAAALFFPAGLAVDSVGNIVFADNANLRVRRFQVGGVINTVAGNGLYKSTPDGANLSQLYLSSPNGVAVDGAGNTVIADSNANAVRLIQKNGSVRLLAGNSLAGGHSPDKTAASALLETPTGVAIAPDGTIYIAESGDSLVRKITPAGDLVTVAGQYDNFAGGYGGDGGPASKATLNAPFAVALDGQGNLYISDTYNHCVRRVDGGGTINTYAGTCGSFGFSGDGGRATAALLYYPEAIAVDSAGNLFIADYRNRRIRRVSPQGVISTFAGTGVVAAPSGNGASALLANLGRPVGLTIDSAGNTYFTEDGYNQVRVVGTDGRINQFAGSGGPNFPYGYYGDGGLATSAVLASPYGLAADPSGIIYIADTGNNRIRTVLTSGPALSVSSTSVSLSANAGSAGNPSQTVAISATLNNVAQGGLAYSVSSSSNWLQVSPASGALPQILTISADATALAAGSYTGTVTVLAPGATPPSYSIAVKLAVTAQTPPQIVISKQVLSFSAAQGSAAASSNITVSNVGGGAASFSASATTQSSGAWLSVTPGSGQVSNGAPVTLTVTANPGTLPPNTYSGSIVITSASGTVAIPVTLSINRQPHVLLVSQTGMTFTSISGGGAPLSQNFGILNIGQGSMNWTVDASLPGGGAVSWLSLSTSSGTVARPYLDVSFVDVSVDPTGLAPKDYYAQIRILSDADNSPQTLTVLLTVKPAGTPPSMEISPSGLIFTGTAAAPPGSQVIRLATQSSDANTFTASTATRDLAPWLKSQPATGTIPPSQPASVTVQPNFATLAPGPYFGTITFLFGDNTARLVNVLTVVAPPGTTGGSLSGLRSAAACGHTDVNFQLTSTQPGSDGGFPAPVGQPLKLQFKILYTCGDPFVSTDSSKGSVAVDFEDSSEPHLILTHIGNGVWEGTWTPIANPSRYPSEAIAVTATWINGTNPMAKQFRQVKANLLNGTSIPVIKPGGVVSSASPNSTPALGLGGLVSIYGSQLAAGTAGATAVPLPTDLQGTQVLLQGKQLPLLYSSDGQINVQIPYEVMPDVPQSLVVNRAGALSTAVSLAVSSVQPSIFLTNAPPQGVIVDGNSAVKDSGHPAAAGDIVIIYCTGLGPVTPPVASGVGAPGPTSLVNPATVTMGGQNAVIQYAGLTPGSPGLYQINAVVPAGASGSTVPVVVTVAGQNSPAATIAIQ